MKKRQQENDKNRSSNPSVHSQGRPSPEANRVQQFKANMHNTPKQQHLAQLQTTADQHTAQLQKGPSGSGLDSGLASGVEQEFAKETGKNLSLEGTKVVHNSKKPGQMNAHAIAQNKQVDTAPGQKKHTGHELTHILQQKAGMVKPTTKVNGTPVNDDKKLEDQADRIGAKAQKNKGSNPNTPTVQLKMEQDTPVQTKRTEEVPVVQQKALRKGKLNVAGELHPESEKRRARETEYAKEKMGDDAAYQLEHEHKVKYGADPVQRADPPAFRMSFMVNMLEKHVGILGPLLEKLEKAKDEGTEVPENTIKSLKKSSLEIKMLIAYVLDESIRAIKEETDQAYANKLKAFAKHLAEGVIVVNNLFKKEEHFTSQDPINLSKDLVYFYKKEIAIEEDEDQASVSFNRSVKMHLAANQNAGQNILWKIGNKHISDIKDMADGQVKYEILTRGEFNEDYMGWLLDKGYYDVVEHKDEEDAESKGAGKKKE